MIKAVIEIRMSRLKGKRGNAYLQRLVREAVHRKGDYVDTGLEGTRTGKSGGSSRAGIA